ncbi:MAG TPA: N-acetylneuraminate synthase family protein [Syntrophorhabdales bacterium]|nr:N-acetylneuraminate synthase family protein [Syntrophorhabdales bacterium]
MRIGKTEVREGRAYIIADVGSNFNGSLDLARAYIDAGKEIGVDAVKFQTYRASTLLNALKPDGERWAAYDVVKKYELPWEWHQELFEHAKRVGVEFLSTPFDLEIVAELDRMGMQAFKIASGDLTFTLLLQTVGSFGKPVILSTGMADLEEIRTAVQTLRESGALEIALLHCVSNYPPRFEQVNLRAMKSMREAFGLQVGLSDHTPGNATALGAIALGASVIEKHITMDKQLGTPDAPFAMTIAQFETMVIEIRNLEKALGDGVKSPAEDERPERIWARRGIYARTDVEAGKPLTLEDVKFVRPADGIAASDWEYFKGKKLKVRLPKDRPLRREYLYES